MSGHGFSHSENQSWETYGVDSPKKLVQERLAEYDVVVERGIRILLRDGIELAGMLWRPAGDGPFPVLVERGPHRFEERTGPAGEYHGARGYAVLSVGLRGFSGSGGEARGSAMGANWGDGYWTGSSSPGRSCADLYVCAA